METEFNAQTLKNKIVCLSAWKKLAFALSICERLYPNFVVFCKEVNFSGHEKLRECLDIAWSDLESNQLSMDYTLAAQECESVAPDTEEYQTIFASSALDAAVSISYLMSYFTNNDIDLILEIASLACDSVDMYVQELENMDSQGKDLEKMIIEHPLMQSELNRQGNDIEMLNKLDDKLNVGAFSQVEKSWSNTQKSNLGLAI